MSSIICTTLLCGFIYLIFGRNSAECISIIQNGWFLKKIWKLFCVLFRSKNGFLFLSKLELLPYPFSSTRTSLLPFRSIRDLNGNPDKNASNAGNLGYFRNLRVSETSVGAIILDSRILTGIKMRSLLPDFVTWDPWDCLLPSKGFNWQIQDPPIHNKFEDERYVWCGDVERAETKHVKTFFLGTLSSSSSTAWVMRGQWRCLEIRPCSSHISRAWIMKRNAGDLSNVSWCSNPI